MSHLKLQKLLFYCEAYHLAVFDKPLIAEDFEAWVHGPVCRAVYDQLKDTSILHSDISFDGKSNPEEAIQAALTSDQLELVTFVLDDLSKWKSLELERATHHEKPWMNARVGYGSADRCEVKISKALMASFYREELK